MTTFILGSPNIATAYGITMLGDIPTPFIGFVDRSKLSGVELEKIMAGRENTIEVIDRIKAAGGFIVVVENPDAAKTFHNGLAYLFSSACDGKWAGVEPTNGELN